MIPHIFRLLAFSTFLFLAACFKSEAEEAIDLVKTGYLSQDQSAPVGKILEGYRFFTSTQWEVFETKQGKRVVEFRGYSALAQKLPERIAAFRKESSESLERSNGNGIDFGLNRESKWDLFQTYDIIDKPYFAEISAALDLTAIYIIQFTMLPNKKFEVSYVGRTLTADPFAWPQPDKTTGPAPEDVQNVLAKAEKGNSQILDLIYADRTIPIPSQAQFLVSEYRRLKRGQ